MGCPKNRKAASDAGGEQPTRVIAAARYADVRTAHVCRDVDTNEPARIKNSMYVVSRQKAAYLRAVLHVKVFPHRLQPPPTRAGVLVARLPSLPLSLLLVRLRCRLGNRSSRSRRWAANCDIPGPDPNPCAGRRQVDRRQCRGRRRSRRSRGRGRSGRRLCRQSSSRGVCGRYDASCCSSFSRFRNVQPRPLGRILG